MFLSCSFFFFQENHIPKESSNNFQLAISKSATSFQKKHQELLGLIREALLSLQSLRNYGPLGWVPWSQSGMVRDLWGLNSHWSTYGNGHEPDFVRIYIPIVRIPENWKWDFSPSPKKRDSLDFWHIFFIAKKILGIIWPKWSVWTQVIFVVAFIAQLTICLPGTMVRTPSRFEKKTFFSPHMWPMLIS